MSRSSKKSDSLYEHDIWRSKNAKKSDLIDYLNNLHQDLANLEQDITQAPKGLHATAAHLVQSKYMENSDRDVRILVTCCVVDVLRIYAPEAPYKDEDMIRVFEAIAKQIRSLQTTNVQSVPGKRILYILNSIATVKSCLVPVLLDQKGVKDAREVVEEMFSAITSIVDTNSTEEVFASVCEILQSCIEEYNNISPELLEILLVAILPAQKIENPMLYRVVATVLQTVSPIIMGTLTSIMSSILVGPGNQFQGKLSEIADDVYALIYELHIISPALMEGILPSLTVQLRSEDDGVRAKVVQLLSKVYATENANYHEAFPRYFRDFIQRMNDALPAIRNEVIDHACTFMSRGIDAKFIAEIISHRLRDPDEDVRKKAVVKLFRQVFDNIEIADSLLLTALFDRVKDRVLEIRKAAMVGMSKLYWKYVAGRLPALADFAFTDLASVKAQVPSTYLDKLQHIPGVLIKCWGYPDIDTKHVTLQLVQEYLLPHSLPPTSQSRHATDINQVRLTAMLLLYALFNEEEKMFFESILTFKAKMNNLLVSLISVKRTGRESSSQGNSSSNSNFSSSTSDQRVIGQLKQWLGKITNMLPTADNKKAGFFDRLLATKDKAVWRLLERATETTASVDENAKYKDDLMKKLDSKSALAEYMTMIFDVASYQLVTSPMVNALVRVVLDSKFVTNAGIPDVLCMLAKHTPRLFVDTLPLLTEWMQATIVKEEDKGKKRSLKLEYLEYGIEIINHIAVVVTATDTATNNSSSNSSSSDGEEHEKLARCLLDGMKECGEEDAVCLLASALRTMMSTQDSLSSRFLRDVVKFIKEVTHVHANGERFEIVTRAIATLLELSPTIFHKHDTKVIAFQTMFAIFSNNTRQALVKHMQQEMAATTEISAASAMLQLLTRVAHFEDLAEELKVASEESEDEEAQSFVFLQDFERVVDFSMLVQSLFACMESRGKSFEQFHTSNESDELLLYQEASLSAMSLISTNSFTAISTEQWHELGLALLQDEASFREKLCSSLCEIIRTQQVPLRFLAYPCLLANDAQLVKPARDALIVAIGRLRRTHEDVASKLLTVQAHQETERLALQQQAAETMPENIMPYLLHILTYHPEFPTSMTISTQEDKTRIKLVIGCIKLLIAALQSKLKVATSNLPFLFKQVNTISYCFVDKLDANNVGLHYVARLTGKLLQEQVKMAENLQLYPGEVFLPRELYEGIEAGKAQLQLGMIATGGRTDVANMLDVADYAIDQVMQVAGKGRNKTGTTTTTANAAHAAHGNISGTSHSPQRKRASKQTKLSFDSHADGDQEDEDGHHDKESRKRAKTSTGKALPVEQPSRSLPARGAKANVKSYVEPAEVTERDMERWNREAATHQQQQQQQGESKKRKSASSESAASFSSSFYQNASNANAHVSNSNSHSFHLSPAKRARLSSSSTGAVSAGHASANTSFANAFPEDRPQSTASRKSRPSLRTSTSSSSANAKDESEEDLDDLFVSTQSQGGKASTANGNRSSSNGKKTAVSRPFSKSASTDEEQETSSSAHSKTESSEQLTPAVLSSRGVRQANRGGVLAERPANVIPPTAAAASSSSSSRNAKKNTSTNVGKAKETASSEGDELFAEEVKEINVAAKVTTNNVGRNSRTTRKAADKEEVEEMPKVTGKRGRQIRA